MLVVRAQADVDADVVQQRGDLQQQPLAVAEAVLVAQLVEQAHRQHRDVPAVRAIEAVAVAERLGAGEHLAARSPRRSSRPPGSATSSSTPVRSDASETTSRRAAVSDSSAR